MRVKVIRDLNNWNQKPSDNDTPERIDTRSNELRHQQQMLSAESAPNSLMTMTADFDQDVNHVTPGGTKSNESLTSENKDKMKRQEHLNTDPYDSSLMPPEESFKKKKYQAIPIIKSEEQKQALKMQIRKKLLSLTN